MKYHVIKRRLKLLLLHPSESAAFIVSIRVLRGGGKLCYIHHSSYKAVNAGVTVVVQSGGE